MHLIHINADWYKIFLLYYYNDYYVISYLGDWSQPDKSSLRCFMCDCLCEHSLKNKYNQVYICSIWKKKKENLLLLTKKNRCNNVAKKIEKSNFFFSYWKNVLLITFKSVVITYTMPWFIDIIMKIILVASLKILIYHQYRFFFSLIMMSEYAINLSL